MSDIVLFEDYPAVYPADISRRYRWIRGDWQIPHRGCGRVYRASTRARCANPISPPSRWKVLDNLRRSLVPIAPLALLLLFGWFLPRRCAVLYTLMVIAIILLPALMTAAADLSLRGVPAADLPPRHQHRTPDWSEPSDGTASCVDVFALATLPYDAYLSLDAIGRTSGPRARHTPTKLLEWRTASDAQQNARTDLSGLLHFDVGAADGPARRPP